MKWDPQKQEWVEAYEQTVLPGPRWVWLPLYLAVAAVLLAGAVLIAMSVAEEEGVARRMAASGESAPSSAAPIGDIPLTRRGAQSAAASMLHGYLIGGADQLNFIIVDVKQKTSCRVAVYVMEKPPEFAQYRREFRETWRGDVAVFAQESGAVIAAVFRCPQ